MLVTAGQLAEAERLYRDALAIAQRLYGPSHEYTTGIRQQLDELREPNK